MHWLTFILWITLCFVRVTGPKISLNYLSNFKILNDLNAPVHISSIDRFIFLYKPYICITLKFSRDIKVLPMHAHQAMGTTDGRINGLIASYNGLYIDRRT